MQFSECVLKIIIYFKFIWNLEARICTKAHLDFIEYDKNVTLECKPNENVTMIYEWRNTTYFGLNPNAYLDIEDFPHMFHKESYVTFRDLKIERGYRTIQVRDLTLINVLVVYWESSFLDVNEQSGPHFLHIENSFFAGSLFSNFPLFHVSKSSLIGSITNSVFKLLRGGKVFSFLGATSKSRSIIFFKNNFFTNNKNMSNFIEVSNSNVIFVNNRIKFNADAKSFLSAYNSEVLIINNTFSMNFQFKSFIYCSSEVPRTTNLSNNHINFNHIDRFLISEGSGDIEMTGNNYFQNYLNEVISISPYHASIEKKTILLNKENFSFNDFTFFIFGNDPMNITISYSTFKFGGLFSTISSCPFIDDAKQLKNIEIVNSTLTACDASIKKRIQLLCEDKYVIHLEDCGINKCNVRRNPDINALLLTIFAIMIGWILLPFVPMNGRKTFPWKKFYDKSTQTELTASNENMACENNLYESVDYCL